jgi:hypothetical protein
LPVLVSLTICHAQVNAYRHGLTAAGVADRSGQFVPLMLMLSSSGEAGEVERFLRALKATMPVGVCPEIIMSDKALAYTAAIAKEFPRTIHRWCHWHTIESWRRWLVNASNGVKDAAVRHTIREVRTSVCVCVSVCASGGDQ